MKIADIVRQVKDLNLPSGSYIVFGSCPMAAAGIRESSDIDMLVDDVVIERIKKEGWQQIDKGKDDKPYVNGDFEAHLRWDFSSYKPTLKHLLETATMIDGIPFASLDEVKKWKLASGRPKDIKDVELIDEYISGKKS